MRRRGAAPASRPSDVAQRWQALFGGRPPCNAALVAAGVAWAEQVAADGDVAPAIQHDLAIVAHQLRVARLDRQGGHAGTAPATTANGAACTISEDHGAACAIWPNVKRGMVHHLPEDAEDAGVVPPASSSPAPVTPPSPRPRRTPARVVAPLPTASSQLVVGARLVKLHGGVTHVVDVTAEGMRYQGRLFASLSAVAKHITGTHWNGLLFFGLRRRKTHAGRARGHG